MQPLELRDEFLSRHMRGTAIELRNKQNTGWAQKGPEDLLAITYPTSDVQRSLEAVSAATPGKPIVFLASAVVASRTSWRCCTMLSSPRMP